VVYSQSSSSSIYTLRLFLDASARLSSSGGGVCNPVASYFSKVVKTQAYLGVCIVKRGTPCTRRPNGVDVDMLDAHLTPFR
jgi:hypothetical protein